MREYRQVEMVANANAEMLSTDDLTGKKSMLGQAVEEDTEFGFALLAEDALVDVEILSGDRTVVRGRLPSGLTAGDMPTPNDTIPGDFTVFAGEEISVFISNTSSGTPRVAGVFDRESSEG